MATTQNVMARTFDKLLRSTSAGRAMLAEGDKVTDQKRAAKAKELEATLAELEKVVPPLTKARDDAQAKVNAVLAQLGAANEALLAADAAVRAAVHSVDHRASRLRADLVKLAPEELGLFALYLSRVGRALQSYPSPWGPRRPDLEELLELLQASQKRAEEIAETGASNADTRAKLTDLVVDIRKGLVKLGGHGTFATVLMDGDPLEPEVAPA